MHSYMGSSMQIKERLIETSLFLALSPKNSFGCRDDPYVQAHFGSILNKIEEKNAPTTSSQEDWLLTTFFS